MKSKIILAGLATMLAATAVSHAGLMTLDAVDRGSYSNDGQHYRNTTTYKVGHDLTKDASYVWRNFLVFDLSGITGPIEGASLILNHPSKGWTYTGPDNVFQLFSVETDIPTLTKTAPGISWNTKIQSNFKDLGYGQFYGSVAVGDFVEGTDVKVELNSASIAAMNGASGGLFAIGGRFENEYWGSIENHAFKGTRTFELSTTRLEVNPVPEPATNAAIGVAALAAFVIYRRRRKQKSTAEAVAAS